MFYLKMQTHTNTFFLNPNILFQQLGKKLQRALRETAFSIVTSSRTSAATAVVLRLTMAGAVWVIVVAAIPQALL